jgi:hypothetical protein
VLLDEDDDELYRVASDDGKPLRWDTDPLSTRWQRFKAGSEHLADPRRP